MEKINEELFKDLDEKIGKVGKLLYNINAIMNVLSISSGYTEIGIEVSNNFFRTTCPICNEDAGKGSEINLTWRGHKLCRNCMKGFEFELTEKIDRVLEKLYKEAKNDRPMDTDKFYKNVEREVELLRINSNKI